MYYNNNNQYNGRYNAYNGGGMNNNNTSPYQYQTNAYNQPINVNDLPIDEIRFMTAAEADAYIVMPNHKSLLIDMSSGVAKVKAANNAGQSITRPFSFKEITESAATAATDGANLYLTRAESGDFVKKTDVNEILSKDFVSRQDFNELLKRIDALQNTPKMPKKIGESV